MNNNQVVLIILDGWGYREEKSHNAIHEAQTPYFDSLWEKYPHSLLHASGLKVGLPEGQIGTSEVGHMTIGSGQIIDTDLVKISKAIQNNELLERDAIKKLFEHVKNNDSTLHLMGLVSPGGVHSHSDHLYGILKEAQKFGLKKVAIHAFTDGRDVSPSSAKQYIKELEQVLEDLKFGFIASVSGRFYGMDRDNNWDRLEKVEDVLFHHQGRKENKKASEIVEEMYKNEIFDEHIEPVILLDDTGKGYKFELNDGVFFFNFRADRARQLSKKIAEKVSELNLVFVTMTEYEKNMGYLVAFPQSDITTTLASEIARHGMSQVHIAETEKAAHTTYFFNGGREALHENERHIVIEGHKVRTHDEAPEMRAKEIADAAVDEIEKGTNFSVMNFANADMVGHTANKTAILQAIEFLDTQLKRVVEKALEKDAVVVISADHGNAEQYFDHAAGEKHTAHTANLVPAIVTKEGIELNDGSLADIAPTVLELFGLEVPTEMTGKSLIK